MFTSTASVVALLIATVMFGGIIKLVLTSLVKSLLPLARSLEIYSNGVEAKTKAIVRKDVAKTELECHEEISSINKKRAQAGLPEVEMPADLNKIDWPTKQ